MDITYEQKIPLIFHQIWYQGIDKIKNPYSDCRKKCLAKLKEWEGWEYMFWDKNSIEKLINENYPQFWDLYNYFDIMVQKIDLAKYIILYHFGGVYVDMDMECVRNIAKLIKSSDELIISRIPKPYWLYNNGILFSNPKNKFWIKFIDEIEKNKVKRWYHIKDYYIGNTTGPLLFTNFIDKNKGRYKIKILDSKYVESRSVDKDTYVFNHFGNHWCSWYTKVATQLYFHPYIYLGILVLILVVIYVIIYLTV